MPEDETHECTFHAPKSCAGEMRDKTVRVTITVTDAGRTGSVDATTRGADAPTCITTLQIA